MPRLSNGSEFPTEPHSILIYVSKYQGSYGKTQGRLLHTEGLEESYTGKPNKMLNIFHSSSQSFEILG